MVRNRAFLAALVLGCASTLAWGLDLRDLLPQVVEKTRARDFRVRFAETTNAVQTPALSAQYAGGECRITALTGAKFFQDVLTEHDPEDRQAVLEAFLAHEIGHCEERHRNHLNSDPRQRAPEALSAPAPRVIAWREANGALMLRPLPYADLWSETLADAYMGAYLHRWHPQRAQRVMTVLLNRRARFAHIDPGHNSARFLTADAMEVSPGESLISAATRIRAHGFSRALPR